MKQQLEIIRELISRFDASEVLTDEQIGYIYMMLFDNEDLPADFLPPKATATVNYLKRVCERCNLNDPEQVANYLGKKRSEWLNWFDKEMQEFGMIK